MRLTGFFVRALGSQNRKLESGMLHATELFDASVYDADSNYVGRVRDLCLVPSEQPSRIARFVITRGKYQPLVANYDQVVSLAPGTVRLNTGELGLATYVPDESWLTVRQDLLDRQIIDTAGRKVVRVNDLDLREHVFNGYTEIRVVQVDVGLMGAVRRLFKGVASPGWLRMIEKHLPTRTIPWEAVDVIETDPMRRVKLRLPESKLAELHPADIADIIEELPPPQREAVIETLDDTTAAETLEEVEDSIQVRILENLDKARIAHILEEMHRDEAVDALAEMSAKTAAQVLQDMDRQDAGELVELLQFEQDTAGGMMTTEVFTLEESATVQQAVSTLRESQEEMLPVDTLHLTTPDGVLTGTITIDRLFISETSAVLQDLRDEQLIFVEADATEKEVVDLFDKYNLRSLPVVDAGQKLLGMVTVDDIVSRLWQRQK